jgi:hypothetical protein
VLNVLRSLGLPDACDSAWTSQERSDQGGELSRHGPLGGRQGGVLRGTAAMLLRLSRESPDESSSPVAQAARQRLVTAYQGGQPHDGALTFFDAEGHELRRAELHGALGLPDRWHYGLMAVGPESGRLLVYSGERVWLLDHQARRARQQPARYLRGSRRLPRPGPPGHGQLRARRDCRALADTTIADLVTVNGVLDAPASA